jgi:small subunit ribosomal protein S20
MPIIKSAKKRVKVSAKATVLNAKTKRAMREAVKSFYSALASDKSDKIKDAQAKAVSAIDVAAKKHVIHKNKAARKKIQLSEALKAANTKPITAKKPITKKVTSKKTVVKKPAPKKAAAKKPIKK